MTQTIEPTALATTPETDLVGSVQRVLQASDEPLTLSKIRARLPVQFRETALEDLGALLHRQVTAQVVWQYPKYRSAQDRFWDRPLAIHIACLLRATLADGPLGWTELRRKLPRYAQVQAEEILNVELARGQLFRHPRLGRAAERYGTTPADPRAYLRVELAQVFVRLEPLGFQREQLRSAALELLHDEEWASPEPSHTHAEPAHTEGQHPAAHAHGAAHHIPATPSTSHHHND